MLIRITPDMQLSELQSIFNKAFPFLKIDFFKPAATGKPSRQQLPGTITFNIFGMGNPFNLDVNEMMTVGELEKTFKDFGCYAQVSRQSGQVWLETTMTDKWTLKQQNEHGRELSEPATKSISDINQHIT
jgi:hypothetical protein